MIYCPPCSVAGGAGKGGIRNESSEEGKSEGDERTGGMKGEHEIRQGGESKVKWGSEERGRESEEGRGRKERMKEGGESEK